MKKALKLLNRELEISIMHLYGSSGICFVQAIKELEEAIAELEEAMKPKTCEWEYNEFDEAWDGKCGVKFQIAFDTPTENHMKFCPQCGGKLIENDLRG